MSDVDPKTRVLLDMIAALGAPPLSETTPQQFRDMRARSRDMLNAPIEPIALVRNEIVAGADGPLRARLYDTSEDDARPTLVYYHGGGFVIDSVEGEGTVVTIDLPADGSGANPEPCEASRL